MPKVKTSKAEVLQKVISLIRKKGVTNSSMNDLAKECNIQKSHFYYYFENKEQLIKDVFATVNSYTKYNFNKYITDTELSLEQKLDKIDQLIFKLFLQNDGGCVMANAALESAHTNPSYFEEIQTFFEGFITSFATLLKHTHNANRAQELAEQIVQDIEGGILLMRVFKDQKYLHNALIRMRNHILH